LRTLEHVEMILDDYQKGLEDLDKVDVLEPNNAFTLQIHGEVKKILHDS